MTDLFTMLIRSATAFTATNLDDIVILMLFFSQVSLSFRHRHIVTGQYLGFAALVLVSLPGFFGSLVFPRPWIGLLGVVPIVIGLSQLFAGEGDGGGDDEDSAAAATFPLGDRWLSPQTASVAAVTVANGGDNVGIYMPLFASADGWGLGVTLAVFFGLVGVWCYGAYQLARLGAIAPLLTQYGSYLVPFVLMGLGVLILVDSHTLEYRGLTALALTILGTCIIHLLRTAAQASQSAAQVSAQLTSQLLPSVEKIKG